MESDVENEVFNVGSGTSTSVRELAETIIELFRSSVKPTYVEEQKIIVRRRQADITKINRLLGFKPKVEIKDGLKDVVSDILAKPSYY
jgi:UDP-glucose 4-epimerase